MELTSGDTRISDPPGYYLCHIFCRNIAERSWSINFLLEMTILSNKLINDYLLLVEGCRHQLAILRKVGSYISKWMCVLIHTRTKGEDGTVEWNNLKPSRHFITCLTIKRRCFFCGPFLFVFVFASWFEVIN